MIFDLFNNSKMKGCYFPYTSGIIALLTGFSILIIPVTTEILLNVSIISSPSLIIIFSVINYRVLMVWGWYMIYGIMLLVVGGYFVLSVDSSKPFVLGIVLFFRFILYVGISMDVRKIKCTNWRKLTFISCMGTILSLLIIFNPSETLLLTAAFICLAIAGIQLSNDLRKVNRYGRLIRSNNIKYLRRRGV